MIKITRTTQFKRDFKKAIKASKNFDVLEEIIASLAQGKKLAPKYKDHKLLGEYSYCRECHIEPDFLLIYELKIDELILIRLGSHSELFK